jgi:hypothetical protein
MAITHLVVDVSGHGYGHAAMTLPILNELRRSLPKLKLTIRTSVPAAWLAERLWGQWDYLNHSDVGLTMVDSLYVRQYESYLAYSSLHESWNERVSDAAVHLSSLEPTLLLSNVPYLSIAAANKAGVPVIAMSSLNWADVFYRYCGHLPGAKGIWQQMIDAYAAADIFLQLTPAMPMPSIGNGKEIGAVALLGKDRRAELRQRFGWGEDDIVALFTLGGIHTELPVAQWPRFSNVRLVIGSKSKYSHPDIRSSAELEFPFIDLVRSCDVLICKPGYGIVTEAACNGIPILLISRPGWPEEACFRQWLGQNGRMLMLTEQKLRTGDFVAEIHAIRSMPSPSSPPPSGISEAVAILSQYLQ